MNSPVSPLETPQTNTTNAPESIPEYAPTVSFDVGLGKKYNAVEFDYKAFMNKAMAMGLSPEEISKLTVEGVGKGGIASGGYLPPTKRLSIDLENNDIDTNKTLTHELQHAADDARGLLETKEARRRKTVGVVGIIAVGLAIPTVFITGFGFAFTDSGILRSINMVSSATGLIGQQAFVFGYKNHPNEIRAREAETRYRPQVIFTSRRPTQ